jgi:catechol-2,3-dioxygenase
MTRIGSLNLEVPDIAAAERFYCEILGLAPDEERSNRPAFVLLRAENAMIILQHAPSAAPPSPDPRIEIGFEFGSLDAIQARLGRHGSPQNMGWGDAIETTDPAGNRINIFRLR